MEQPKAWQAKIAAIHPTDEKTMAVEQYALHGDEEGGAVSEHAGREEEATTKQELALEDPALLAQAAPKLRNCRVYEWICCITDQSFVDTCSDSFSRTRCQLQLGPMAGTARTVAHSRLSHEITRWSYSLQDGKWNCL